MFFSMCIYYGILPDLYALLSPRKEYALREDNLKEFQDLRCTSENDGFEDEEEREERAKDEEEEKEIVAETEVEDVEEEGREKEMRGGENKTAETKNRRKKKETEKKQSGGRGLTKSVLIFFLEKFENILWFLFQNLAGDVESLLKVYQSKGSVPTGGPPQPLHEGEAAASE